MLWGFLPNDEDNLVERGLSGEQLAEKIGKCHPTIYKVENGRFAASVDMLAEFCDALDAELVVRKKEG